MEDNFLENTFVKFGLSIAHLSNNKKKSSKKGLLGEKLTETCIETVLLQETESEGRANSLLVALWDLSHIHVFPMEITKRKVAIKKLPHKRWFYFP